MDGPAESSADGFALCPRGEVTGKRPRTQEIADELGHFFPGRFKDTASVAQSCFLCPKMFPESAGGSKTGWFINVCQQSNTIPQTTPHHGCVVVF